MVREFIFHILCMGYYEFYLSNPDTIRRVYASWGFGGRSLRTVSCQVLALDSPNAKDICEKNALTTLRLTDALQRLECLTEANQERLNAYRRCTMGSWRPSSSSSLRKLRTLVE